MRYVKSPFESNRSLGSMMLLESCTIPASLSRKNGDRQSMQIGVRFVRAALTATLFGAPILGGAQSPQTSLDTFVSQSVGENENQTPATIGEWVNRKSVV